MGVGRGANSPTLKKNCLGASKKFSRILWRRPRPKLGCGAKERRRKRRRIVVNLDLTKELAPAHMWREFASNFVPWISAHTCNSIQGGWTPTFVCEEFIEPK
jgi:hypothetical protein